VGPPAGSIWKCLNIFNFRFSFFFIPENSEYDFLKFSGFTEFSLEFSNDFNELQKLNFDRFSRKFTKNNSKRIHRSLNDFAYEDECCTLKLTHYREDS
jgi:hypothetical protein